MTDRRKTKQELIAEIQSLRSQLAKLSETQSQTAATVDLAAQPDVGRPPGENNVSQTRQFYERVLDDIPIQIGVFDLEGTYLYANAAGIKNADTRRWIMGKRDLDYCSKLGLPEDIAHARRVAQEACVREQRIVSINEAFPAQVHEGHPFRAMLDEMEFSAGRLLK